MDVGNFITGSSAFFKSGLNLYNFPVHVLLKPSLENFENYFSEWGPREPFWWLQLQRIPDCSLMRDPEPDHPAKLLPATDPQKFCKIWSIQESPAEAWVSSGLLLGQGQWIQQCVHKSFWRRSPLPSLPLLQSGLRPSNREGTQFHTSTENSVKNLLNMAPPFRTRPSFPYSQSLPSGSFHKPLILLHQRGDRMKITEN